MAKYEVTGGKPPIYLFLLHGDAAWKLYEQLSRVTNVFTETERDQVWCCAQCDMYANIKPTTMVTKGMLELERQRRLEFPTVNVA